MEPETRELAGRGDQAGYAWNAQVPACTSGSQELAH